MPGLQRFPKKNRPCHEVNACKTSLPRTSFGKCPTPTLGSFPKEAARLGFIPTLHELNARSDFAAPASAPPLYLALTLTLTPALAPAPTRPPTGTLPAPDHQPCSDSGHIDCLDLTQPKGEDMPAICKIRFYTSQTCRYSGTMTSALGFIERSVSPSVRACGSSP